jgi:aminoglycoside N3'-acetyltransferase
MRNNISKERLVQDFKLMGILVGDIILVRANLAAVGRLSGGAETFIDALLDTVGAEGTIVSLAFTNGSLFKKPKIEDAFNLKKKSYAGALPNGMIARLDSLRSKHPMCSYVAIGKYAEHIIAGHDENSPAYDPVRKIIELNGKNLLVGCVESSPGFTTAHLAEADLGMLKRLPIFSNFTQVYYENDDGGYSIYKRSDPGLCSNSFYKFYALYVIKGILKTGFIGEAFSIIAPSRAAYDVEYDTLAVDPKFNICSSKDCFTCNANRWDRLHCMPVFLFRMIWKKFKKASSL